MKILKRESPREVGRYEPEKHLMSLRDAMDRMMSESVWDPFDMFSRMPHGIASFPKVDISESDKEVKVVANIPGIDPDEVELEVSDDSLSLSGKVKKEEEERGKKFYRYEREYGEFRREFSLPAYVDPNRVNAKVKNGVLTITLPKSEEAKRKKIKVDQE